MIKAISKRMRLLENLLHKETVFSSEAKVADLITKNATLFQHLKNNEIASILNMTPETFSRILTKLKKEEIISIDNHVVTILDQNALQHIIDTNSMKRLIIN
jgi:CRP/FNR family transcriptional regulator